VKRRWLPGAGSVTLPQSAMILRVWPEQRTISWRRTHPPACSAGVSCDESGVHGARNYGFGTLWMRWQRRGEFAGMIDALRAKHRFLHEFKWSKVCPRYIGLYRDLAEAFFKTDWLAFHALVVERAIVTQADIDLARRIHFTKLLTNKIQRCLRSHPRRQQTFRIWVDPIHSRYAKADEAVEVIANNVLARVFGMARPVDKVLTHDSHDTPSIMMCDVLLGAVMDAWQQKAESAAKQGLAAWIAKHLGWEDLHSDTQVHERKLNVWVFYDPPRAPRKVTTRSVHLRYPLPCSA
jgi:hypothetical protein